MTRFEASEGISMSSLSMTPAALIATLLLATPLCPAQAQGSAAEVAAVASAVRAFHAALEAGDAKAASRLLAPDAVILESGDRETRKEYLDHHLQADIEFVRAVPTRRGNPDVTVNGDAAWVISTSAMQGTFKSRPIDLVGAELMVLSKTPAGWVIRSIHWSSRDK
jgi:ketosteroid isomerase-like protein